MYRRDKIQGRSYRGSGNQINTYSYSNSVVNSRDTRDGCLFCTGNTEFTSHDRKSCPTFRKLKSNASIRPYISTKLKPQDEEGYAATGVLPWCRDVNGDIQMLFAREYRTGNTGRNGDALNFLGGKRETRRQRALDRAVDKVDSETGSQLSEKTVKQMRNGCPLVCWSPHAKYALFLFELTEETEREVDLKCTGIDAPGVKRLEWATRSQLLSRKWVGNEMHGYAASTLAQIISCNVMGHLERLFDVAPVQCVGALNEKGLTPEQRNDAFDVLSALKNTLKLACPEAKPMSRNPNAMEILDRVKRISDTDIRKLERKFHPDRVRHIVHRDPTEDDKKLSNIASQFINSISGDKNHKDISTCLEDLNKIRAEFVGSTQSSSQEIEDMLNDLSLRARPKKAVGGSGTYNGFRYQKKTSKNNYY